LIYNQTDQIKTFRENVVSAQMDSWRVTGEGIATLRMRCIFILFCCFLILFLAETIRT
jgi:hypothetical protein